jgi:hypothetical protein
MHPLSAAASLVVHCCALQGFPEGTWPVVLHLVEPNQGDTVNVHQAWTWSVFAVTSAMIGAHAAYMLYCAAGTHFPAGWGVGCSTNSASRAFALRSGIATRLYPTKQQSVELSA